MCDLPNHHLQRYVIDISPSPTKLKANSMNHFEEKINSLSIEKIKNGLNTNIIGHDILVFDSVTSTMDIAREKIGSNTSEGLTILAEQQSSGKGRRGRVWCCPKKKGLLVSIILQPIISPDRISFLTGIASVAVAEAIYHMLHIQAKVKWPNDIIINNKKVAGILVEVHGACKQTLTFAVGIGINVNLTKEELPNKTIIPATSLSLETGATVNRIKLTQTLLQTLDTWYSFLKENRHEFIRERWRDLCLAFKQKLTVNDGDVNYTGEFVDITSNGNLILGLDNNTTKVFYR